MAACPLGAFRYNATLCHCGPGLRVDGAGCVAAPSSGNGMFGDWSVGSGVPASAASSSGSFGGAAGFLLSPVTSIDGVVRTLTNRSEAALLYATLASLALWFGFCIALRFAPLRERRWFRLRWWVSRLDCLFAALHWTDDQQVVKRRKTEFGGMCSVASWILFVGLLSALLYQVISRRNIEVHRLRAAAAPDLLSFDNDLQFDITTISDMTCANFRAPSTLVVGNPGSVDYRVYPLSAYISFTCRNSTLGPVISLKCSKCRLLPRDHYISWQFVDLTGYPASAVGFCFNLTAKSQSDDRYMSFVNGTVVSTSFADYKPTTYRGRLSNVLKAQLFPQAFLNLQNLKLIQPLVQDFIPGSSYTDVAALKSSLENPANGVLNTTLFINYLSDYIVEVDRENVLGPLTIIASIGGLYTICVTTFLCSMLLFEARVKKLCNEDVAMLDILSHRRAQRNWDKVRKFVMYTWGPANLIPDSKIGAVQHDSLMESLRKRTLHTRKSILAEHLRPESRLPSQKTVVNTTPSNASVPLHTDQGTTSESKDVIIEIRDIQ